MALPPPATLRQGAPVGRARNTLIYQLKVGLLGVKPPVWRRLQVVGGVTLGELHGIIQVAMGWTDSHLHSFEVGADSYGAPDSDWGSDMRDERRVRLSQLELAAGSRFGYTYDFGDDWRHGVLVEQIGAPEPGVAYPRCVGGRRACPPEDCGGPWGYADLLEILADPAHEEFEGRLEWAGGQLDPVTFDQDEVNNLLHRLTY